MINTDDKGCFFSAYIAQWRENAQETNKILETQEIIPFERNVVLFIAPMSGDWQSLITPAPVNQTPSSDLPNHLHAHVHK